MDIHICGPKNMNLQEFKGQIKHKENKAQSVDNVTIPSVICILTLQAQLQIMLEMLWNPFNSYQLVGNNCDGNKDSDSGENFYF